MSTGYLLSLGAIITMAGVFLFSQEKETEIDRVSRQVEALQKEVSSLASQVQLLREEFANLKRKGAGTPAGIPSGAREREINGVKYYIVPIGEEPDTESP